MKKELFVAGVQFRPSKGIVEGLTQGTELYLEPEPENKFDPNAIKVMFGHEHLGYIPAKFAAEIGAAMEIHDDLHCILTTYEPKSKPWERLGLTITNEELTQDA